MTLLYAERGWGLLEEKEIQGGGLEVGRGAMRAGLWSSLRGLGFASGREGAQEGGGAPGGQGGQCPRI